MFLVFGISLVLFVLSQILFIIFSGTRLPVPNIPRTVRLGKGPSLRYIVMGDSTAIGQGVDYKESIAYLSAEYLAKNHTVTLTNLGVSGATTGKVLRNQVEKATALKPDVILVCIGANDVTHLSSLALVEKDVSITIKKLKKNNQQVKIIFTGAPAMGSVPRFLYPTKFLAGLRTKQINAVIQKVTEQNGITRLKIAEITSHIFLANPQLFANDKFHPNAKGYATWMPIIIKAL